MQTRPRVNGYADPTIVQVALPTDVLPSRVGSRSDGAVTTMMRPRRLGTSCTAARRAGRPARPAGTPLMPVLWRRTLATEGKMATTREREFCRKVRTIAERRLSGSGASAVRRSSSRWRSAGIEPRRRPIAATISSCSTNALPRPDVPAGSLCGGGTGAARRNFYETRASPAWRCGASRVGGTVAFRQAAKAAWLVRTAVRSQMPK